MKVLDRVLRAGDGKRVKALQGLVPDINALESEMAALSDSALQAKTGEFRSRLERGESLDDLLVESFAVVREASSRVIGQRHFDVQLMGGAALHFGWVAEMKTGEGKTLVSTLPAYLNGLSGNGVHVITVNDYLARFHAEWMGRIHQFMGLNVGLVIPGRRESPAEKRIDYACDITYGTNNEFGFDYLRDNMAASLDDKVQRGHNFAIVDEVDSILIDEARTPLIISGPATVSTHQYDRFKPLIEQLVRKQNMLCNRLATEARELVDAGKSTEAGRTLFKLKFGQPRNKALLRLLEDTEMRKAMDKAELEFYKDTDGKAALVALKEELYFTIEERQHEADLTEMGRTYLNPDDVNAFVLPDLLTEYADIENDSSLTSAEKIAKKAACQQHCDAQSERIHNITQLLKAYCLYEKDVEYVVEENKVMIVDTFTGRKMPGRRWSDGLHQAVEAKEGVQIDRETQTLATITIQNYFRLYQKLAGMTGTAETEVNEFHDIYRLDVNVIPTNRPIKRLDENDRIYKTRREKYNAAVEAIKEAHGRGQPVLVGTASVEASELMSRMLKLQKIPHSVLNAKFHMQEAEIVSRAGLRGAVTISTNMAGRGTDIKLGEGVAELGGLFVIATERHESRRIDRQLRGRCARQGDPGRSRFYVSFEDDLMRNFGASDRMTKIMETFGLKEGEELEHPWLNRSVETAQKRVEQRNYLMRKRTLEFDDVMNQQREVVYGYRNEVMDSENPRDLIIEVINEVVPKKTAQFLEESEGNEPDVDGLLQWINATFPLGLSSERAAFGSRTVEENGQFLVDTICDSYQRKVALEHQDAVRGLERYIILNAVDRLWQEHLYAMDGLREAVYLRSFGQKDPLVEYKNDAYVMFVDLMDTIKGEVLTNLFRSTTNLQAFEHMLAAMPQMLSRPESLLNPESGSPHPEQSQPAPRLELPLKRELPKAGRNDPCPCGSGKKFKSCCGRLA